MSDTVINIIDPADGSGNHRERQHINDTNAAAAAAEPRTKRDPGLSPTLSTAAVSASLAVMLRPTPKGLHSHDLLTVAYILDVTALLVLGILLFGLTFALHAVPDKWLGAVRAAMTAVAGTLLLLLLLLAAFNLLAID